MVRRQVLRARSLWLRLLHLGTPPRAADGGAQALHRVQGPHAQASRRQTRGGGREDQGLIARPFAKPHSCENGISASANSVCSLPPCGGGERTECAASLSIKHRRTCSAALCELLHARPGGR